MHGFILEMSQQKGFKSTLGYIKSKLVQSTNLKSIEETLARLDSLGTLVKEGSKLVKKVQHIYTTKDVMNQAVREYHKKLCQLAAEQIENQPVETREYNGVCFNIKKTDIPKIKQSLRELSDQIIQEYEVGEGEGDETYQLNIHFFALTK